MIFIRLDPNKGYLGRQLWLPKAHINTRAVKAGLEFPVMDSEGLKYIQLWEDVGDHLVVPRSFIPYGELGSLQFPVVSITPDPPPRVEFESRIVLDAQKPHLQTQKLAAAAMCSSHGGLLNLSCGKGKTVLALHLIEQRKVPALVIVNNTTLINQWRDRIQEFLDVPGGIGLIQGPPNKWDWQGRGIVLAMIHSLGLRHAQLPMGIDRYFGLVIYDECFVAGTPVDGIPIEQRKVGDLVWSFDEDTGSITKQPVEHVFVSRPRNLMSVIVGGEEIVCTHNHPFWTQRRWVAAIHLTCEDVVLCFMKEQRREEDLPMWETNSGKGDRGLLPDVLRGEKTKQVHKVPHVLRQLWGAGARAWAEGSRAMAAFWKGVLLRRLYGCVEIEEKLRGGARHQHTESKDQLSTYEEEEPDERCSDAREAEDNSPRHGVAPSSTGREWTRDSRPTAATGQLSRLAHGSYDLHQGSEARRGTHALQNRYSERGTEDRHRGGRPITPVLSEARTGRSERRLPAWTRVDRTKVHQQTSDGTFGGRCPNGLVYNLQIKGSPTYLVGRGPVVHNCHHVSAPLFLPTAPLFYGERHGLTATTNREDGLEAMYQYHIGQAYFRDLSQDLKPRVYFQACAFRPNLNDPLVQEAINDKNGKLCIPRLRNYLGTHPECNEFIASKLRKPLESGRKVLALSHSVEQLQMLNAMFADSGLCTGNEKPEDRITTIQTKRLSFGTLQLVKEALDEASLDTLFFLTPFGSSAIEEGGFNTLQQGIGRIQRHREGKKTPVVVILDYIYVPKMHKMCTTLKKQLRGWPVDQGGPLDYTVLRPYMEGTDGQAEL